MSGDGYTAEAVPAEVTCPFCGTPVAGDSRRCPVCGAEAAAGESPTAAEANALSEVSAIERSLYATRLVEAQPGERYYLWAKRLER